MLQKKYRKAFVKFYGYVHLRIYIYEIIDSKWRPGKATTLAAITDVTCKGMMTLGYWVKSLLLRCHPLFGLYASLAKMLDASCQYQTLSLVRQQNSDFQVTCLL